MDDQIFFQDGKLIFLCSIAFAQEDVTMNISNRTLLELLNGSYSHFYSLEKNDPEFLTPEQMARLYIISSYLVSVMEFIKEQLWLKNKEDEEKGRVTSYLDLIGPFFIDELLPVLFLKDFLVMSGPGKIKKISKDSEEIMARILFLMVERSIANQKDFIIQSLKEMKNLFLFEEKQQEGRLIYLAHKGPRLYKTFDNIDMILNLNYQQDRDMSVDCSSKERLYLGAGAGVQSGYSTILLALHNIELEPNSIVVDLGSGYGRVGLVYSLLRPDIHFIGFEYVPHRVKISNKASKSLGLEDTLLFKTQDLSLRSFNIPEADVYYLYDPFTDETYNHVLKQIVRVSNKKRITIITKGNARNWLNDIAEENSWPKPVIIDNGNLCIFKSA